MIDPGRNFCLRKDLMRRDIADDLTCSHTSVLLELLPEKIYWIDNAFNWTGKPLFNYEEADRKGGIEGLFENEQSWLTLKN